MNRSLLGIKKIRELSIFRIPLLYSIFKATLSQGGLDIFEELIKLVLHCNRFLHRIFHSKCHERVPFVDQAKESYLFGGVSFEEISNGDEVFQALWHFEPINVKMACVPEMIDPIVAAIVGLRLSKLVVMVRETKINSSRVNVNRVFFENWISHCRTFNMPSRSSWTPFAIPWRLVFLGFFP